MNQQLNHLYNILESMKARMSGHDPVTMTPDYFRYMIEVNGGKIILEMIDYGRDRCFLFSDFNYIPDDLQFESEEKLHGFGFCYICQDGFVAHFRFSQTLKRAYKLALNTMNNDILPEGFEI